MASPLIIKTGWPGRSLSPNGRVHWRKKASAVRAAKNEASLAAYQALGRCPGWSLADRLKVTIRAHPAVARQRDDDNLIASCKPFRDGIADRLGVDDSRFDLQPVVWGPPTGGHSCLYFEIEAQP
jgi:crossover junction endodeoxyribonuclease RusA